MAYFAFMFYEETKRVEKKERQKTEWYRRLHIILNNRELNKLVGNKDIDLAVNQGTYERYEKIIENMERLWIDKPETIDEEIAEKIFKIISELQDTTAPASISFICEHMPQKIKQLRMLVKKHI